MAEIKVSTWAGVQTAGAGEEHGQGERACTQNSLSLSFVAGVVPAGS